MLDQNIKLLLLKYLELVGFDRSLYVTICLIGDSGIAQPPAPTIAGADMDTQFSRDAPG